MELPYQLMPTCTLTKVGLQPRHSNVEAMVSLQFAR
jgi:hypothetical protein